MARTQKTTGQRWVCESVKHEFAILEAVQRGIRTRKAIADHIGLKYAHTSNLIRGLVDAEVLERVDCHTVKLAEVKSLG